MEEYIIPSIIKKQNTFGSRSFLGLVWTIDYNMKTIENEDYKAEEKCRIFIRMENKKTIAKTP
jgi:hypothetical protein